MLSGPRLGLPRALFVLFLTFTVLALSSMIISRMRNQRTVLDSVFPPKVTLNDVHEPDSTSQVRSMADGSQKRNGPDGLDSDNTISGNGGVGAYDKDMSGSNLGLPTQENVAGPEETKDDGRLVIRAVTLPNSRGTGFEGIFRARGKIAADDPLVISALKDSFIFPPSDQGYVLKEPEKKDFSMGQIAAAKRYLNLNEPGFFVECGALDGETRSNTLYLEREYGWKGLLVEGDPSNFELLLRKHRKSYSANVCLSPTKYPSMLPYYKNFNLGRIRIPTEPTDPNSNIVIGAESADEAMPCFPLFSLLLALNRTVVDFFSLDVEGSELDVLQTIPFDKIYIKVITVEFYHVRQGKASLEEFVTSQGFTKVDTVTHRHALANDYVYVNNEEIKKLQAQYVERVHNSSSPSTNVQPAAPIIGKN